MKVEVEYLQMDDKIFEEFTTLLASIVANYLEQKGLARKLTGGDFNGKERLLQVHTEANA